MITQYHFAYILLVRFAIAIFVSAGSAVANSTVTSETDNEAGSLRAALESNESSQTIDFEVEKSILTGNIFIQNPTDASITLNGALKTPNQGENHTITRSSDQWANSNQGGLFLVGGTSELIANDVNFVNGSAVYQGGAIYTYSGKLQITDCRFSGNSTGLNKSESDALSGTVGGAIAFLTIPQDYESHIRNTTFDNNQSNCGGAIYVHDNTSNSNSYGQLMIESSIFSNNKANQGEFGNTNTHYANGGAINISTGHINVTDSLFQNNTASGSGGAIDVYQGAIYVHGNSAFIGNQSGIDRTNTGDGIAGGGAICSRGSQDTQTNINIVADGSQDMLFLANSTMGTMDNNGTQTAARGGAIFVYTYVDCTLKARSSNIIFAGNTDELGSNAITEGADIGQLRSTGRFYMLADQGQSIRFHDSVDITSDTLMGSDADSNAANGAIIFTGATYSVPNVIGLAETDLGGKGNSAWLVSQFANTVKLANGSLNIEDNAKVVISKKFTASSATNTTLRNGILSVGGGEFEAGSTLKFQGQLSALNNGTVKSQSQLMATSDVLMNGNMHAAIIDQDQLSVGDIADFILTNGGAFFSVATDSLVSIDHYKGGVDLSYYLTAEQGGQFRMGDDSTYYITFDESFQSILDGWMNESHSFGDRYRIQIIDSDIVSEIAAKSKVVFTDAYGTAWDNSVLGYSWNLEDYWSGASGSGLSRNYGYYDLVYMPEPSTAMLSILGFSWILFRRNRVKTLA